MSKNNEKWAWDVGGGTVFWSEERISKISPHLRSSEGEMNTRRNWHDQRERPQKGRWLFYPTFYSLCEVRKLLKETVERVMLYSIIKWSLWQLSGEQTLRSKYKHIALLVGYWHNWQVKLTLDQYCSLCTELQSSSASPAQTIPDTMYNIPKRSSWALKLLLEVYCNPDNDCVLWFYKDQWPLPQQMWVSIHIPVLTNMWESFTGWFWVQCVLVVNVSHGLGREGRDSRAISAQCELYQKLECLALTSWT
jgi:hypothetical protein